MSAADKQKQRTVSLVLGSGGARGLAHIGVIRWLEENGYQIRSIAGSSMGALVGGIYAAGKLEVYAEWVTALERMHVLRLLDPSITGGGLFKGERIIAVLRELIGDRQIDELSMSYTAVATDLHSGKEIWLREGRLFDAIRASIATPLVFTPVTRDGLTLLDGALVNPLPIAPTLNDRTDLTVAVTLSGPRSARAAAPPEQIVAPPATEPATPEANGSANYYRQRVRAFFDSLQLTRQPSPASHGMFDIAFASMEMMEDTIARLKLAAYAPDVTVEVPRDACAFHEFWRAKELIALGHERAAEAFFEQEEVSAPAAAALRRQSLFGAQCRPLARGRKAPLETVLGDPRFDSQGDGPHGRSPFELKEDKPCTVCFQVTCSPRWIACSARCSSPSTPSRRASAASAAASRR
ncbi:patatin-like phospholipase family protein [Piscinibacter sakaiensis]|uniref:patatin-like phospholipase family protein n=1 Tax=Piscinibacter sakaiensis TaxID=1547922 RepID=UPI003AB0E74A